MFSHNDREVGNVRLPDPADIPQPEIRAALEHYIELRDAKTAAWGARDAAAEAALRAENSDALLIADEVFDNPSAPPVEPGKATRAALEVKKETQAALNGVMMAKNRGYRALLAAVVEHGDEWRESARSKADKAVLKLTTAAKSAEVAKRDLDEAVGVLILIDKNKGDLEAGGTGATTVGQGRYAVSLQQALPLLVDAVGKATNEVNTL